MTPFSLGLRKLAPNKSSEWIVHALPVYVTVVTR
jgi:hypothetical protein